MAAVTEPPALTPQLLSEMLVESPFKSYHDLATNCGIAPSVLYKYMKGHTSRLYAPSLLHLSQALPKHRDIFIAEMHRAAVGAPAPVAKRAAPAKKKSSASSTSKKKK